MDEHVNYAFGSFRFQRGDRLLTRDGIVVKLTPKASELLLVLLENHGRVLSREELGRSVWQGTFVEEGTLPFHIHLIRNALGDRAEQPTYIQTVPRRGYRFAAPVSLVDPSAADSAVSADMQAVEGVAASEPAIPSGGTVPRSGTAPPVPATQPPGTTAAGYLLATKRHAAAGLVAAAALAVAIAVVALAITGSERRPPRVDRVTQITHDGRIKNGPLLTDGTVVVFEGPGRQHRVRVSDGKPHEWDRFTEFSFLDFSTQRAEALGIRPRDHGAESALWIVPLQAGAPTRVGTIKASAATWSPDGQQIAYTFEGSLYVTDRAGARIRSVGTFSGSLWGIRWAAGQRFLRFSLYAYSARQVSVSVWDVSLDGLSLRRSILVGDRMNACCGGWIPGTGEYVFEQFKDDSADHRRNPSQLAVLLEDARLFRRPRQAVAQLTYPPMAYLQGIPDPAGGRIFTIGLTPPRLARFDIARQRASPFIGGVNSSAVAFSNDGRWLVYVDGEGSLWRARADGSEAHRLTIPPFDVDGPAWSPDDRWLAFRARRDVTGSRRIHLMPSAGGSAEAIPGHDGEQGFPSWSRDGTRIAFGDVPETFGVADGTERIHIFERSSGRLEDLPDSGGLWTSRWSPDGRYLAALTISDQSLMVYHVAAKKWRSLNVRHVEDPRWSHDSRFIFCGPEGPITDLRRVDVATGAVESVLNVRDRPMQWVGLAPDGAPLVLIRSAEVYALELDR
jgi:DNA-binding winged helix-turn-helix (wHTH) protein/Tol biopolymer transport system component